MNFSKKYIKDREKLEKLTYDIREEAYNVDIAERSIKIASKYMLICNNQRKEINNLVKKLSGEMDMLIEDIKGIVVIGYPGIGKTSQSKQDNLFVDLESRCFYLAGSRIERWYIIYCNQAINIAEQGKIVFVSSHKEVREYLTTLPMPEGILVLTCFPSKDMKEKWISKLHKRYQNDMNDKNWSAFTNALENYDENIQEMMDCSCPSIVIEDTGYSLKNLILDKVKDI